MNEPNIPPINTLPWQELLAREPMAVYAAGFALAILFLLALFRKSVINEKNIILVFSFIATAMSAINLIFWITNVVVGNSIAPPGATDMFLMVGALSAVLWSVIRGIVDVGTSEEGESRLRLFLRDTPVGRWLSEKYNKLRPVEQIAGDLKKDEEKPPEHQ